MTDFFYDLLRILRFRKQLSSLATYNERVDYLYDLYGHRFYEEEIRARVVY